LSFDSEESVGFSFVELSPPLQPKDANITTKAGTISDANEFITLLLLHCASASSVAVRWGRFRNQAKILEKDVDPVTRFCWPMYQCACSTHQILSTIGMILVELPNVHPFLVEIIAD
jgi:hypothetical protein